MSRRALRRLGKWLLEVEMGFVWGVAGISIFVFVFAAIWYIDPALLTLVLQFRQAECTTVSSAFLIGISNCSWTSCRLGCTREVYKCWQVQVDFEFVQDAPVYRPPWASISDFGRGEVHQADYSDKSPPENRARLYPNVRGCGYPPELNCETFYEEHGKIDSKFTCWVSTMDNSIAMTELDLERAKSEVIYSLVPLFIFIVFVLYAFCRHGVFSVCNPLKMCPRVSGGTGDLPPLTPKQLLAYRRELAAKKSSALAALQTAGTAAAVVRAFRNETEPPETIVEEESNSKASSAVLQGPVDPDLGEHEVTELQDFSEPRSTSSSRGSSGIRSRKRYSRPDPEPTEPLLHNKPLPGSTVDVDDLLKLESDLYPLKPVSSLKHQALEGEQTLRHQSFSGSFNSLFSLKDDTKSETKTIINELFLAEELNKMEPFDSKIFHDDLGASSNAAAAAVIKDADGIDSLDDFFFSSASSNFGSSEQLRRKPNKSAASSSFSAWADDSTTDSINDFGYRKTKPL